ncbi:hypothetical protein AACH06_03170 [Ideonella sp. DXS29W]|uniref:Uncharacterized protein n=1 Tax=Ideonella lacteola TaxID=2984193 RepID=A0ABU9BIM6_9BURK
MKTSTIALTLSATLLAAPAFAGTASGCIPQHPLEPASSFPSLPGRLVFHSYVSYGDGGSRLFLYDFAAKTLTRLDSAAWNITDPMNAHFSPDGKRLVFMGRQLGNWHVFVWTPGSPQAPVNLTSSLGGRNEDPKYSFDGTQLVIKHEGDLYLGQWATDGQSVVSWQAITTDGWATEESMPYLTPSGKYLFFVAGTGASMRIRRMDMATKKTTTFSTPPDGAHEYYPVVRDYSTYFYTRTLANTGNDQILRHPIGQATGKPEVLALNDCDRDNSDAAPVDEDLLAFSSDAYDSTYELVIGDLRNGKVWRIAPGLISGSDGRNKLGANYTARR